MTGVVSKNTSHMMRKILRRKCVFLLVGVVCYLEAVEMVLSSFISGCVYLGGGVMDSKCVQHGEGWLAPDGASRLFLF